MASEMLEVPYMPEVTTSRLRVETAELIQEIINNNIEYHGYYWNPVLRWFVIIVYGLMQVFISMSSTSFIGLESFIQDKFGGSTQLITLGQSGFLIGNAVGPLITAPLSDMIGRKWIYVCTMLFYGSISVGFAFVNSLTGVIILQFLLGAAGAAGVCNTAGTITDLFPENWGAQPMGIFVVAANSGPAIGAPLGSWLSAKPDPLRWYGLLNAAIAGGFTLFLCFMPETLPRSLVFRGIIERDNPWGINISGNLNVQRWHFEDFDAQKWKPRQLSGALTMVYNLITQDPIILSLGLYNGFAFGLIFLYLDGVYRVFVENNHLRPIFAELTFLNFVVGVCIMWLVLPLQSYLYHDQVWKKSYVFSPESRFHINLYTVWLIPMSLFWFAWTCNGNHSYWHPIAAGTVLGFADPLLWLSMLQYVTDTYEHLAATSVAAFMLPSFLIAAGMAHLGKFVHTHWPPEIAFNCLAFISFVLCFYIHFLHLAGNGLRHKSALARDE